MRPLALASSLACLFACGSRTELFSDGPICIQPASCPANSRLDAATCTCVTFSVLPDAAPLPSVCTGVAEGVPVTLASGLALPTSIVVDAESVYWLEQGSSGGSEGAVKKVPLCGGPVVTLAAAQNNPSALALDASHVYWVVGAGPPGSAILAVEKAGGTVSTLVPAPAYAASLVVGVATPIGASISAAAPWRTT